jgi:hypothetical protein
MQRRERLLMLSDTYCKYGDQLSFINTLHFYGLY